ncbi:hypothetical protein IFM89_010801 [Coptis chinensis]|uniref:Uncharacterized protein n=1 Tax=Coptis chinensis TaxID=261450 RepID=A0A835IP65_9MAGN|nr:hypothetical protein IFM89_010801 [Coptis chinensis]
MMDRDHTQGVNEANPGAQTRNWNELFQGDKETNLEIGLKQFSLNIVEAITQVQEDLICKDSNLFYFKFTNEEDEKGYGDGSNLYGRKVLHSYPMESRCGEEEKYGKGYSDMGESTQCAKIFMDW